MIKVIPPAVWQQCKIGVKSKVDINTAKFMINRYSAKIRSEEMFGQERLFLLAEKEKNNVSEMIATMTRRTLCYFEFLFSDGHKVKKSQENILGVVIE